MRDFETHGGRWISWRTDQPTRLLVAILVLSVVLRVGVGLYLGDVVPPPPDAPDDTSYSYLAARLADGHGYSFDRPWYPFGKPAGSPTAHWSFLYTAFVAAVYRVAGPHPLAARLVSAVLGGVLLPWIMVLYARRLFPGRQRLALVAAGCSAIYAYFVLYAARLVTETFYIVAVLWVMERAMALADRPKTVQAISFGLALAVAALLRQTILPWAIVLFAWLLWSAYRTRQLRSTMVALGVAGSILVAAIVPFTVRNYMLYDEFLLLNSNAGYVMYSAQHPMHGTHFEEHAAAPLPENLVGSELNEAQLDRALLKIGLDFIRTDPWRYVQLSVSRVRAFFVFWPTADSSLLYNVGRVLSFTLFLPVMVLGLSLALRDARPFRTWGDWIAFSTTPAAPALLFAIFYSTAHVLTWAMIRYRLPVDAIILPFAALALDTWLIPYLNRLPRRRLALPEGA
ncbi:MAG: glycosyltransferase family 39 protein [Anaerolineae bacterium]|nr:glycosyltransferase family 39 protein [Anaerolineae bacterium]